MMLRITVDFLPHGDKDKAQTIGVMEIMNDGTGTIDSGNYTFWISKLNTTHIGWLRGRIRNFKRLEEHVWTLLYLCLKQRFGDKHE
jgi:hypothetical protein